MKRSIKKDLYKYTADAKYIRNLKNSHQEERCFIIGNGPSLTIEDLNLLKNEFCFAFNRVFEVFNETDWRPSIYMCVDKNVLRDFHEDLMEFEFPILALEAEKYKAFYQKKNVKQIENYVPFLVNRYGRVKEIPFSEDASICMYGGATVTYTAMQLAFYMGFEEIYLLGVDHSYSHSIDSTGKLTVDNSVKNYFGNMKTLSYTVQAVETVNAAYDSAAKYAKSHGLKIYNVTRGGKLECFPRALLEDVLQKK